MIWSDRVWFAAGTADQQLTNWSRRMSVRQRHLYTWAVIFFSALSLNAASESSGTKLMSASRASLCVTEGAIEELPGERLP